MSNEQFSRLFGVHINDALRISRSQKFFIRKNVIFWSQFSKTNKIAANSAQL
jgi:hypothetical protein